MANHRDTNLSSVFDGMLTQSKKQFEDLYRGPAAAIFGGEKNTPSVSLATSISDSTSDSAAARRLRERFGSDWHYDIKERHRDGDEAIVLGRLTFGGEAAVRTQFGRAKIQGAAVAGASAGVAFRVGEGGGARDEQDAFKRAAEAALANCVDLI